MKVGVGDTVRWTFVEDKHHTTESRPDDPKLKDQPETWASGVMGAGQIFQRAFVKPGLYQYQCHYHWGFGMRGEIEVGADAVARTLTRLRVRTRRDRKVTVTYRLNEPASVIFRLSGPRKKNVGRKRSAAGAKAVRFGKLLRGRYSGYVLSEDDFDKVRRGRLSFVVR